MCGLNHVSGVDVVMVGDIGVVVVFQSHHERQEGVGGYLEGPQQISLLNRAEGLTAPSKEAIQRTKRKKNTDKHLE